MHLHTRTSLPKYNHSREQENHQAFRCFKPYVFNAKSEARKPFQASNLVFFNALIVVPARLSKDYTETPTLSIPRQNTVFTLGHQKHSGSRPCSTAEIALFL